MGAIYRYRYQPAFMKQTPPTFPNLYILNIVTDTGDKYPNTDDEMTYLGKNNIYEAIRQQLSNKYVYETNMYKI